MIYQNDPRMPEAIQRWGCLERVGMRIGELEAGRDLELEGILALHEMGVERRLILHDEGPVDSVAGTYCFVLNFPAWVEMVCRELGLRRQVSVVGEQVSLATTNRRASWGRSCGRWTVVEGIMNGRERRHRGFSSHFTLAGPVEWDPVWPKIALTGERNRRFLDVLRT